MLIAGVDKGEIDKLKREMSGEFAKKDLRAAIQILGMRISKDMVNGVLKLSQEEYVNKVLSRFNMDSTKPLSTPLATHFKLSKNQSPNTDEERAYMAKVPYVTAIGSLMYAMVGMRPN